ncbi:hypothetical protein [Curtanaerobium respiraculi]|uniref:hypothetical protein n=1 Tax=Curtanaerobium respiraculi TaxID=2949669 RepID=UPI0024B35BF5|nr:hypothetical protein [Curtanaerobium respiraculi]
MATRNDRDSFVFTFDPELEGMMAEPESMDDVVGGDPGVFKPNTEGRSEFLPPDVEHMPVIEQAAHRDEPSYAARPAAERTEELFNQMRPHRLVMLDILDAAREPIPASDIDETVLPKRKRKFTVYSPSDLCTMLEVAGALERVTADGTPFSSHSPQPNIVKIDGEEYWEPAKPPAVYWRTTSAGMMALDANAPEQRLRDQFDRDSDVLPLYKRVLRMAAGEGTTMSDLSGTIDRNPLIAEPRRYFVQHFVEALERCEAIYWDGSVWRISEVERKALREMLADVPDDEFVPDEDMAAVHSAAETDGINW